MLIKISRSGGFAGIEEDLGSINTSSLDEATAEKVKHWLSDLDQQEQDAEGADMYRYEIAVHDDPGEDRTLVIGGGGDPGHPSPDALRHLCEMASS